MVYRMLMIVAALVVMVTVLGCSDGDDTAGDGDEATIAASATEYQFDPDEWTVSAGDEFSIDFTNDGTLEHEWAVIDLGEDIATEAEFEEDKVLLEVEAIPAGESTTASFTIDEPGTYQVICAIETHFDNGMEGTLTVE